MFNSFGLLILYKIMNWTIFTLVIKDTLQKTKQDYNMVTNRIQFSNCITSSLIQVNYRDIKVP